MEQKLRRDRCMGDNLRVLRENYDISREKLCAELQRRGCDIGRSTYAKYEAGELNVKVSVVIELKRSTAVLTTIFLRGLIYRTRECDFVGEGSPLSKAML